MSSFSKWFRAGDSWRDFGGPILVGVVSNVAAVYVLLLFADFLPVVFYKHIDRSIAVVMLAAALGVGLYLQRFGARTLLTGLATVAAILGMLYLYLTMWRPWCPDSTIQGAKIVYEAEPLGGGPLLPITDGAGRAVLMVGPDVETVVIRARIGSQHDSTAPIAQELFDCNWNQTTSGSFRAVGCSANLELRRSAPRSLLLTMFYPPCRLPVEKLLTIRVQP